MKEHEHTFAIIAYRESPYLDECVASIKKQTVASHIFIATPTPSSFLDKISERHDIPIVLNTLDEGIAANWSFAYNSCKTRYVTLAHQDDIYLPEYTEKCLSAAGEYPHNLIVFTDYFELLDGKRRGLSLKQVIKNGILYPFYLFRNGLERSLFRRVMLSFGNPILCSSVMFNKERIGVFEFSREFSYNLDWDAWLRLSQVEGSFIYIKERLVLYRIHKDSELAKGTINRSRVVEDEALFKRLWPNLLAKAISKIYVSLSYR